MELVFSKQYRNRVGVRSYSLGSYSDKWKKIIARLAKLFALVGQKSR